MALSALVVDLTGRLELLGWRSRSLDPWNVAVFTREITDGFTDAVEIHTASILIGSRHWPIPLHVRFGLGFEPMTSLMPVVTVRAESILVDEPGGDDPASDDHEPDEDLAGPGPDTVAASAERLVALISDHRWDNTRSRANIDGLARAFADHELTPPYLAARWQPLLAAVTGDHDRARQLLDQHGPAGDGGEEGLRYTRFARQLRRWLDAAGPPVPPAEQTLRALPPPPPRPARLSLTAARAESRAREAARDAARAASPGLNRDGLIAVLEAEYIARGLKFAPSQLAMDVHMLELDRQPFGKTRRTLQALHLLKNVAGDAIKLTRHTTGPEPDWLKPPATATYTVRSGPRRWVAVHPTADPDLIARITTAAPRRLGPIILIDTWLSPDPGTGELTVHIGDAAIGTIKTDPPLGTHLAAAKFYDEHIQAPGQLTPATQDTNFALEIELPSTH